MAGLWICSACHANLGEDFFTKAQRAKNDKARRCKGCIEAGNESRPIPAAPVAKAKKPRAPSPLHRDYRTGQITGGSTLLENTEKDGFGRDVPLMQRPTLLTHDPSGHGNGDKLIGAITRADRLGMAAQEGDLVKARRGRTALNPLPPRPDANPPPPSPSPSQVRKLLKGGVDVNYQNAASGVTPLGVAAERDHVEVCATLLAAKGDPNIPTFEGITVLHIAVQFGRTKIVAKLLEAGANPDARAKVLDDVQLDLSPLDSAARSNRVAEAELLLKYGATVDLCNKKGQTALYHACGVDAHPVAVLLLDAKADITAKAHEGDDPLWVALEASGRKHERRGSKDPEATKCMIEFMSRSETARPRPPRARPARRPASVPALPCSPPMEWQARETMRRLDGLEERLSAEDRHHVTLEDYHDLVTQMDCASVGGGSDGEPLPFARSPYSRTKDTDPLGGDGIPDLGPDFPDFLDHAEEADQGVPRGAGGREKIGKSR